MRRAVSSGQVVENAEKCMEGVDLVQHMEVALQNMKLISLEKSAEKGILHMEYSIFDVLSTSDTTQSGLYILPVYYNGHLFVRYLETGLCTGFTQKFKPVLAEQYGVDLQNIFMWNVYTPLDIHNRSKSQEYQGRASLGYRKKMYTNQKSPVNLLTVLKDKLNPHNMVFFIEKKAIRQNSEGDR